MILWDIDAALATDNNPSHPLTLKTVTRKFSPGIIDLFQQFHSHYLISLLSTQIPHEEIVSLLQFNQIHHCIHAIHCSDDDARWRSHEEQGEGLSNIFEFILKKAKVKASDCVYISSSDHSTYRQMTKEMGIHSIGMGWDHNQLSAEDLFFQGLFSSNFVPFDFLKTLPLKLFILPMNYYKPSSAFLQRLNEEEENLDPSPSPGKKM